MLLPTLFVPHTDTDIDIVRSDQTCGIKTKPMSDLRVEENKDEESRQQQRPKDVHRFVNLTRRIIRVQLEDGEWLEVPSVGSARVRGDPVVERRTLNMGNNKRIRLRDPVRRGDLELSFDGISHTSEALANADTVSVIVSVATARVWAQSNWFPSVQICSLDAGLSEEEDDESGEPVECVCLVAYPRLAIGQTDTADESAKG